MTNYEPTPRYYNLGKQPIVGESCSLVNTLFDCADQITLGDYVSFGHDCKVLTAQHDYTLRGEQRQVTSTCKPVTIEDGVWIASGVTICMGITIGENSVVGAGSVVTRSIPPNELWAGVPARWIKAI